MRGGAHRASAAGPLVDYVRDATHRGAAVPPAPTPPTAIVPVMAYPDIKERMYQPLREICDELLVPNLG